jgi:acetyl-CoA acetyltransferase
VWDNFGFDPATGQAMIATAGNAARKHRIDRREVDELTAYRYRQYFDARKNGILENVLVPLDILSVQGRPLGRIDDDTGIRHVSLESLRAMRELDTGVTGGSQTHASDGMATLLVTHRDRVAEVSKHPEIDIRIVGKAEVRAHPSLMPEAPALAVQKLLGRLSLTMNDIAVVKNHNPFSVNDVIFSRMLGHDWRKMNNTGCSLVWGHPQGPTLTRVTIEALEEAVKLGGGNVLVFGCAAGDIGIAAVFHVGKRK